MKTLDLAALNAEKIPGASNLRLSLNFFYNLCRQKKAVGSNIDAINEFDKNRIRCRYWWDLFRKMFKKRKTQELILNEKSVQKKYSTSTPTIYINDKKYEDKHEFKSFKKQDKLL